MRSCEILFFLLSIFVRSHIAKAYFGEIVGKTLKTLF